MGGRSMNQSLDLGMTTNHKLPKSTRQSPKLSEYTKHSFIAITPNQKNELFLKENFEHQQFF
jgi:hypothetical protein